MKYCNVVAMTKTQYKEEYATSSTNSL